MSKTGRSNHRRGPRGTRKAERRIIVRGVRREPPDLRKLSRAVIAIAMHEAEADAEAKSRMDETMPPETEQGTDVTASDPEVRR